LAVKRRSIKAPSERLGGVSLLYFKTILALLVVAVQPGSLQTNKPINSYNAPYVCNFAKVFHLKAGHYLAVRSDRDPHSSKIDKLQAGTVVYICDETEYLYKVYYEDSNGSCPGSSEGLDVRKTSHCKTGWVNKNWIDVISG
jgi:hypothetical protein